MLAICLAISIACGIVAGCFGRVWYRQQTLRLGQNARSAEAENLQLARQCSSLQAKIALLHAPTCLETYAEYRMAQPQNGQLLRVSAAEMQNPSRRNAAFAAMEVGGDGQTAPSF
jgi:hypothetical protein